METQISPSELRNNLETFTGTETFHSIPLLNTRFTDGIKYLADVANCFWLVTDVSVIAKSLMDRSYFVTIDFKKLSEDQQDAIGYEAIIEYGDGNGNVLETHKYHSTDFPLDKLRLFFTDGTLLLPSEH
ncbi:hypothetical protein SAMN05421636_101577 [Pricia antarctica]|uniref:DUF6876 domain-containing protein n=1 Tax=Pricia antarctica TaxID=641691 RepID=A0A1G6X970_9FLAO|nr:DUF6876 family protein [Pricia antarctica]SDD74621.1 hypothetical protein SAMN05421636_101577 [Pricia antarctica]